MGWALTRDRIALLAVAPLLTTVAYTVLCTAYGKLGIFTTWQGVFLPPCLFGLALMFVLRFVRERRGVALGAPDLAPSDRKTKDELLAYLPYVLIGVGVCLVYFVKPLDGPESFTWKTDNTSHLNLIWRFVKSGNWSSLNGSLYENLATASKAGAWFYPAGWHVYPCMAVQALDVAASLAVNAFNAVLIGVTIPTSCFFLVRSVMEDTPLALRLGAVFPLAFGVFPWHIIIPEAKESFFFGMTLAPVCIAVFVVGCESVLKGDRSWRSPVLALLCLAACGAAHPITDFSIGVLLVPYFIDCIWRACTKGVYSRGSVLKGLLFCLLFMAVVICIWTYCYNVPAIHSMASFMHWSYTNKWSALVAAVSMGFKDVPPQPLLALFVWTGVAFSLYRRKFLWLSCGFGIFSLMFIVDATSDHIIKQYLTGFWFTDYSRLAGSACIAAVPLAALGLYVWVRIAQRVVLGIGAHADESAAFVRGALPVLGAFLSAAIIFYPSFEAPHSSDRVTTAFGYTASQARKYNSFKNNILASEEIAFLDKVKGIVGNDLVLNCPVDGSAFAYAMSDINIYYRNYQIWDLDDEAKLLVKGLSELDTNEGIRQTVDGLDAKYVLLLDEGFEPDSTVFWKYYSDSKWSGFAEITDETAGLDLVLSEGDMRLFRIVDEAA